LSFPFGLSCDQTTTFFRLLMALQIARRDSFATTAQWCAQLAALCVLAIEGLTLRKCQGCRAG
jgi:hypothetical protein